MISHRPTDHIPNHHKQHSLLSSNDFCDNDSDFCAGAGTGTCIGTGTGSPAGAAFSHLRGCLRAARHPRALPASLPPCRRRACAPRPLQRPLAAAEAQVSGRRGSAAPRGAAPSRAGVDAGGSSGGLRRLGGAPVEPRWSRRGRPVPYVTPGPSARRAGPADPNGPQRLPTAPGTAGTSSGELGGGWEVTIKQLRGDAQAV